MKTKTARQRIEFAIYLAIILFSLFFSGRLPSILDPLIYALAIFSFLKIPHLFQRLFLNQGPDYDAIEWQDLRIITDTLTEELSNLDRINTVLIRFKNAPNESEIKNEVTLQFPQIEEQMPFLFDGMNDAPELYQYFQRRRRESLDRILTQCGEFATWVERNTEDPDIYCLGDGKEENLDEAFTSKSESGDGDGEASELEDGEASELENASASDPETDPDPRNHPPTRRDMGWYKHGLYVSIACTETCSQCRKRFTVTQPEQILTVFNQYNRSQNKYFCSGECADTFLDSE